MIKGRTRRDVLSSRSRFTYKISAFNGLDAESDAESLSLGYCNYCYNVTFKNGVLQNGIGVDTAIINVRGAARTLPNLGAFLCGIRQAAVFRRYIAATATRDDRIVVKGGDGYIYQCGVYSGNFARITEIPVQSGKVSFCNYYFDGEDKLLITSESGGMYVYDGETATAYADAPPLTSTCLHYDRLFGVDAADASKLRFSNDLNPTDWVEAANGAGYISFMDDGGAIVKLLSFKDGVYIFREHAIHRLTAYTTPADYSLNKVYSTDAHINAETVCIADSYVLFMADNNLYSFDGYSVTQVYSKITAILENSNKASAAYYNNKYYLTAKLKTDNDSGGGDEDTNGGIVFNNGMIIIDIFTGSVSIFRGSDIRGFLPLVVSDLSVLLVYFTNFRMAYFGLISDSGEFFSVKLNKLWRSPKTKLGYLDKLKNLRRIYIDTKFGLNVSVYQDESETVKQAYASEKPNLLTYLSVGDSLGLKLYTDNNKMYVSGLLAEFDLFRRYNAN